MPTINQVILQTLEAGPKKVMAILAACHVSHPNLTLPDLVTDYLTVMQEAGSLLLVEEGWALSYWGEKKLEKVKVERALPVPARLHHPDPKGYSGAELQATCLRKGAYDFLLCDSVVNGELIPYRTAHLHEGALK